MTQHILKINSSDISYFVQKGSSDPVVFLHGFCEESSIWSEFLEDFSESFLVCIDLPGFGKSDSQNDCSIQNMASITNSVLEDLKTEKCILIGHSMGGYVALEFAKLFPEKILALGLFHSQPFADSAEKKENRQKGIEFVKKNGSIHFVKQLIPKLFASHFGSQSSLIISKLIHNASKYPKEGIINALQAMIERVDNQEILIHADYPVLFIVGSEDEAIPSKNSFNQLSLPNISDIHILNRVGHMGMFEAKKECVSIIKNFIDFASY